MAVSECINDINRSIDVRNDYKVMIQLSTAKIIQPYLNESPFIKQAPVIGETGGFSEQREQIIEFEARRSSILQVQSSGLASPSSGLPSKAINYKSTGMQLPPLDNIFQQTTN